MTKKLERVRNVGGLIVCWVPLVTIIITVVVWWEYVIGEISTQWSGDEVSTVASTWTALLLPLGGSTICATVATIAAIDNVGQELRKAFFWSFGISAMLVFIWFGIMLPNVLSYDDPPAPAWLLLSPLVLLLGFIPWTIVGRRDAQDDQLESPVISRARKPLSSGTRTWTGSAWSPLLVLIGGGIGLAALLLGVNGLVDGNMGLGGISTFVAIVILLVVAVFAGLMVAVDDGGVRVRSWLGIPLKSIPLESILAAEASRVHALAWGGIGYRVGPQGTALLTRSGPALQVSTRSGSFFVSLEKAEEAATVIDEALARANPSD